MDSEQESQGLPASAALSMQPDQPMNVDRPADNPPPLVDPLDFFQPATTHADTAAFAKDAARRTAASSALSAFARAAHLETLPWVVFPILIPAVYLAVQHQSLGLSHLIYLMLGAGTLLAGVNLLRGAAQGLKDDFPLALLHSTHARLGAGFAIVGAVLGFVGVHGTGPGATTLGLAGVVLAAAYVAAAIFLGAVPGEEIIPAVLLGPMLFFLTMASQNVPHIITVTTQVGKKIVPTQQIVAPYTIPAKIAWDLALALGLLVLAAVVASRLGSGRATRGLSTRALVGTGLMRFIFAVSLVGAYCFALLAAQGHDVLHAPVAVLLSIPVAILPLTGVMRAATPKALAVLLPQMRRTIIWFGGWLVVALIVGSAYLRLAATLYKILGQK
jgi:1,4-dihydroxy-2-naphthoate octaprenyltransferase